MSTSNGTVETGPIAGAVGGTLIASTVLSKVRTFLVNKDLAFGSSASVFVFASVKVRFLFDLPFSG